MKNNRNKPYLIIIVIIIFSALSYSLVNCNRIKKTMNLSKETTTSPELTALLKSVESKLKEYSQSTEKTMLLSDEFIEEVHKYTELTGKSIVSLIDSLFPNVKILNYMSLKGGCAKINPICMIFNNEIYEFIDKYPFSEANNQTECSTFLMDDISKWLSRKLMKCYIYDSQKETEIKIDNILSFSSSCITGVYNINKINDDSKDLPEKIYFLTNTSMVPKYTYVNDKELNEKLKNKFEKLGIELLKNIPLKDAKKKELYLNGFSVIKLIEKKDELFVIGSIFREDDSNIFLITKYDKGSELKVVYYKTGINLPINNNIQNSENKPPISNSGLYSEEIFLGVIDIDTPADKDGRIAELITVNWLNGKYIFNIYMYDPKENNAKVIFTSKSEG